MRFHYKSPCSRSHISFKAYRIFCNYSKRRIVQDYLLAVVLRRGVQENCLLSIEKSYTDLAKVILSSGVQVVDFGCTKSRIQKISSGVAWGLDVGQEDRTRIKSLVFAFAFF